MGEDVCHRSELMGSASLWIELLKGTARYPRTTCVLCSSLALEQPEALSAAAERDWQVRRNSFEEIAHFPDLDSKSRSEGMWEQQ